MPELPEVETIVNQLRHKILGKKILKAEVLDAIVDSGISKLPPFHIKEVYRRAKYIIFALSTDKCTDKFILTHLGMTGQFFFIEKSHIEEKKRFYQSYQVAKFMFEDGSLLSHNNMRKFGSMRLLEEKELQKVLSKLGPEPLEENFTSEKFHQLLAKKSKANIKTTLMDQSFIAGIGNIYAQEVLYYAGISPLRKTGSFSQEEAKKLYESIRRTLKEGIKYKGASVDNYTNLEGQGEFQKHLAVYGKEHCPKKHSLKKLALGGRGTSYCPICQK